MQLSNYKQCLVGTVQLYNSKLKEHIGEMFAKNKICLLYTSPSPRDTR